MSREASPFGADEVLAMSRSLTIVVADDGTVLDARGGFGGFLGWDADQVAGSSVFDFLPVDEVDQLATYFIENDGVSAEAIALTAPFRMTMLDPDGFSHAVDVIPTGVRATSGRTIWVAVVVPVALFGSITRSLDLEMAGADRQTVKRMLCEELAVDDESYTNRWFLVDFRGDGLDVVTSRESDAEVAQAVRADVLAGSTPWHGAGLGSVELVDPADIGPATLDAMTSRGWQRAIMAPVHLDGRLAAVFFQLGRIPQSYLGVTMRTNVAARISRLVDATTLLMQRWDDEEQLHIAATYDPLTGLHNARSLRLRLDDPPGTGAVLFVDVDRFKPVNDTYGHAVGDEVLSRIAARIADACRPGDFVARAGGDEFAVLLDGADAATAARVGERIIEAVSRPLELPNGPERVTVSVGLASLDTDNAFDAADQAMLVAKRSGRSRLTVADDA